MQDFSLKSGILANQRLINLITFIKLFYFYFSNQTTIKKNLRNKNDKQKYKTLPADCSFLIYLLLTFLQQKTTHLRVIALQRKEQKT